MLLCCIDRCGRAGQWEVALALLHDTRKRGPPPTASVYIATAQACARAGKWEEATELKEVRAVSGDTLHIVWHFLPIWQVFGKFFFSSLKLANQKSK